MMASKFRTSVSRTRAGAITLRACNIRASGISGDNFNLALLGCYRLKLTAVIQSG
jgi:hypothetical protein